MHFSTVMPDELRSELEPLTSTRKSGESWMHVGLSNGETEATVIGLGGTVLLLVGLGFGVVLCVGAGLEVGFVC